MFSSLQGQTNLSAKFDVIRVDLQASEQFKSVSSFSLRSKFLTVPNTPWGVLPDKKLVGFGGPSTIFRTKSCALLISPLFMT